MATGAATRPKRGVPRGGPFIAKQTRNLCSRLSPRPGQARPSRGSGRNPPRPQGPQKRLCPPSDPALGCAPELPNSQFRLARQSPLDLGRAEERARKPRGHNPAKCPHPTPPHPALPARRKTHSKKPETKWGAVPLPNTSPLALGGARPHPEGVSPTPRDLKK